MGTSDLSKKAHKKTSMMTMLALAIGICAQACVGGPVTARIKELRTALEPLVGQHKDAVLVKLGPPTESYRTDTVEVWRYRIQHGTAYTRSESYQEFDQYDFTMIRDTVSTFRVRVIR